MITSASISSNFRIALFTKPNSRKIVVYFRPIYFQVFGKNASWYPAFHQASAGKSRLEANMFAYCSGLVIVVPLPISSEEKTFQFITWNNSCARLKCLLQGASLALMRMPTPKALSTTLAPETPSPKDKWRILKRSLFSSTLSRFKEGREPKSRKLWISAPSLSACSKPFTEKSSLS